MNDQKVYYDEHELKRNRMSDMNRTIAGKTSKVKRSTASSAGSRKLPCASAVNDRTTRENVLPNFDADLKEIAYGKFLHAMLEDCLVDEKVKREETEIEIQMTQLADRFQKTMSQLDRTNRRLKDIKFVVEQKRLLDLKATDCKQFCEMTDESNVHDLVNDVTATEKACLDKLETKNVDFGYSKDSGHKKLLDAVTEALDGLDQIKKHSNLDPNIFEEYRKSKSHLKDLEKDRFEIDSLKMDFDAKFPRFSERLVVEASEKIAMMMKSDDEYGEDEAHD